MENSDTQIPAGRSPADGQTSSVEQDPTIGQQQQRSADPSQQPPTGQADYGSAGQSDPATQQRSDIEGGTSTGQTNDVEGSSSVGAQSQPDISSDLVEDDGSSDFARDGQGAVE